MDRLERNLKHSIRLVEGLQELAIGFVRHAEGIDADDDRRPRFLGLDAFRKFGHSRARNMQLREPLDAAGNRGLRDKGTAGAGP